MKIGFLNALTLIFVIFKLANVINWSWLLVFLPTIIGLGIWLFILLVGIIILIVNYFKN